MNTWLIVANTINEKEVVEYDKMYKKCKKQLSADTEVYVIHIYNKKRGKVFRFNKDDQTVLLNSNQESLSQTLWLKKMLNVVLKLAKPTALLFSGHAGGVGLGKWTDFLMSLAKFNKIFIKTIKPEVVAFDACYLGSIVSLYEISDNVKYCLASPSWHPFSSITGLKSFGNLPKFTESNKDAIFKKYVTDMACEFNTIKNQPNYSCLVAFDLTKLQSIIPKIKKLEFTKDHNLKMDDKFHFDLVASIDKKIAKDLEQIVLSKHCMQKCPITIQGISISHVPKTDSWFDEFDKTKWGKFVKTVELIYEE